MSRSIVADKHSLLDLLPGDVMDCHLELLECRDKDTVELTLKYFQCEPSLFVTMTGPQESYPWNCAAFLAIMGLILWEPAALAHNSTDTRCLLALGPGVLLFCHGVIRQGLPVEACLIHDPRYTYSTF
ncbi:hypothetical protein Hamer_G016020 [Homarus americanus]|uniref:Uncharacterized protein n=1 Tax=Homarus americanus TaxID=6706 RepID=A0A8J5MLI3_HOMAM|nr:hypothetical protein Hamer_G016020 [Homarus americanus]